MGREGGGGYGEQFVRRIPEHLLPPFIIIFKKEYKDLSAKPNNQLPF
jgi:hypothetical protein